MMVNHMQWTNISNDEDGPQSVDSQKWTKIADGEDGPQSVD